MCNYTLHQQRIQILWLLYSNMYEETCMEFTFWCDLFTVNCSLSKMYSMKLNMFKQWRFVYCIPCTRSQNYVSPLVVTITYLSDPDVLPEVSGLVLLHVPQVLGWLVDHQEEWRDGHYPGQLQKRPLELQHQLYIKTHNKTHTITTLVSEGERW